LMDMRIATSNDDVFYNETVALVLAPFTSGSSWTELPRSYNFTISGSAEQPRIDGLETARLLHHHGHMFPSHRAKLTSYFRQRRPDRLAWLEERRPVDPSVASPHTRVARRILRYWRQQKKKRFLSTCTIVDNNSAHHD